MLRGWLRAPLPGPAPPAWEGAGAAGRGLSGALAVRAARAAATEAAAEEDGGRGPRAAGLAGGAPGPGAAAAAAGSPRSGLSAPLFVSAPGEGRVMSLLPGAGKQRPVLFLNPKGIIIKLSKQATSWKLALRCTYIRPQTYLLTDFFPSSVSIPFL